jgi:hypothetical protein
LMHGSGEEPVIIGQSVFADLLGQILGQLLGNRDCARASVFRVRYVDSCRASILNLPLT